MTPCPTQLPSDTPATGNEPVVSLLGSGAATGGAKAEGLCGCAFVAPEKPAGLGSDPVSDDTDGIFKLIDFTLQPQACIADINNIHHIAWLVRYDDPVAGGVGHLRAGFSPRIDDAHSALQGRGVE